MGGVGLKSESETQQRWTSEKSSMYSRLWHFFNFRLISIIIVLKVFLCNTQNTTITFLIKKISDVLDMFGDFF